MKSIRFFRLRQRLLVYTSLQDLVDDVANSGRINSSLPVEVRQPTTNSTITLPLSRMNGVSAPISA
jgi:hypothetical protein